MKERKANSRRAWYEEHMKGRFEPVNIVKAVAMIIRILFMTVRLIINDGIVGN